ncbi:UDP-N-acetylmuramate dehydrogenase [Shewanella aestuarii]|uniref:UDP-N-acetylenolpyruvoylglucosamine reductase n=1 Tax=Shewanella aestuarii TaxID=1028752 RepID=A0A6G9QGI1_9GAMM|nr:UDP-N-acetylmuramate dehydrogenase [Shewanella aestuarii]QIR13175.1 UDP-N-acetylmuramate dehydrogenase [Shewanella aestuarii]
MPASLREINTLGLDVCCDEFLSISDKQELVNVCYETYHSDRAMLILGGGSNVVFSENFAGTVIQVDTKGITQQEDAENVYLTVEAGENWHDLVKYCLAHGIYGIENLALIPGSVGAAPIQNIGAYGVELADVCHSVEFVDLDAGEMYEISNQDCQFSYRESIFKQQLRNKVLITAVTLKLSRCWKPNLSYVPLTSLNKETVDADMIVDLVCKTRASKLPDPRVLGNVGSFFKNPIIDTEKLKQLLTEFPNMVHYNLDNSQHKLAAGWLIDNAGLKGVCVGGACIHQQQALVIVNNNSATGADVCNLALKIIDEIEQRFDVQLEVEPRIIAEFGEVILS